MTTTTITTITTMVTYVTTCEKSFEGQSDLVSSILFSLFIFEKPKKYKVNKSTCDKWKKKKKKEDAVTFLIYFHGAS